MSGCYILMGRVLHFVFYFIFNFIPQLFVLSFVHVGPSAFSTRNTHLHNNTSFL